MLGRSHGGEKKTHDGRSAGDEFAMDKVSSRRDTFGKGNRGGRPVPQTFVDDSLDGGDNAQSQYL